MEVKVNVVGERSDIIKKGWDTNFLMCPIVKLGSSYYAAPDCRSEYPFMEGQEIEIDPQTLQEVKGEDLELLLF